VVASAVQGVIVIDAGDGTQSANYAHDATDDAGSATAGGPADGATMHLGNKGFINVMSGDICEIVIYDSVLDAGTILQLEAYATNKWGVAWA
jgi:hypothetical protein